MLGLEHLNLHDGGVRPMIDVFDLGQRNWTFRATPAAILYTTRLSLPPAKASARAAPRPAHDASWCAAATRDLDFRGADRIDPQRFNRILWEGLKPGRPYPGASLQARAAEP